MRRSLWSLALVILALGGLAMVGGTAIGGPAGPLAAMSGVLMTLCALYLIAGLALRDRVRRHSTPATPPAAESSQLGGVRIF
jgi:hypothetical protein